MRRKRKRKKEILIYESLPPQTTLQINLLNHKTTQYKKITIITIIIKKKKT